MSGIATNRHISTCDPHVSFCAGCYACEFVCSLSHEGYVSPQTKRLTVERDEIHYTYHIHTCQNCVDSPCYEACPLQDSALCYDEENEVAYVVAEECTGCGSCVDACIFTPSRIHITSDGVAVKCDLCRGREGGSACIEFCQHLVLGYSGTQVPTAEEGVCYA